MLKVKKPSASEPSPYLAYIQKQAKKVRMYVYSDLNTFDNIFSNQLQEMFVLYDLNDSILHQLWLSFKLLKSSVLAQKNKFSTFFFLQRLC